MKPLISMVLIAKDEAHNVDRCFASWWKDVDEVILCDTGSTDSTIAKARAFAKAQHQVRKLKVVRFEWCDDFAAARNHADTHATGEWLAWCDLDDTIEGLANVRQQLPQLPPEINAVTAVYNYATDEHGNVFSQLWRERVVRAGQGTWDGTIHEVKYIPDPQFAQMPPSMVRWVHHRDHSGERPTRNVKLLQAWREREPGVARCMQYLGTELMGLKRFDEAAAAFREHLTIAGEHPDVRSQVARLLCMCLGSQTPPLWEELRDVAGRAIVENPSWPDTYLTLAEIGNDQREYAAALLWADRALDLGMPQTSLVVNPMQYTIHPRMLKSTALWGLGRHQEAIQCAREVMAACPDYLGLGGLVHEWEGHLGAMNGIRAMLQMADMLIEADEPQKALALLACAPAPVTDHPLLTERRIEIQRRLDAESWFPPLPADSEPAQRLALQIAAVRS